MLKSALLGVPLMLHNGWRGACLCFLPPPLNKLINCRKKEEVLRMKHKLTSRQPCQLGVPKLRVPTTPAPGKHSRGAPAGLHTTSCLQNDGELDNESEECVHLPLEALAFGVRALQRERCNKCYEEGCYGCACSCTLSEEWVEHDGGHFFPTCKKCGGEDCGVCVYVQ
jgi:hypothetical protein